MFLSLLSLPCFLLSLLNLLPPNTLWVIKNIIRIHSRLNSLQCINMTQPVRILRSRSTKCRIRIVDVHAEFRGLHIADNSVNPAIQEAEAIAWV